MDAQSQCWADRGRRQIVTTDVGGERSVQVDSGKAPPGIGQRCVRITVWARIQVEGVKTTRAERRSKGGLSIRCVEIAARLIGADMIEAKGAQEIAERIGERVKEIVVISQRGWSCQPTSCGYGFVCYLPH